MITIWMQNVIDFKKHNIWVVFQKTSFRNIVIFLTVAWQVNSIISKILLLMEEDENSHVHDGRGHRRTQRH